MYIAHLLCPFLLTEITPFSSQNGRMAATKKTSNGCQQGSRPKGPLPHFCILIQPLWKLVCRFLRRLKVDPAYDPRLYLDCNPAHHRNPCSLLFSTAKSWDQPVTLDDNPVEIHHFYLRVVLSSQLLQHTL